MNALLLPDSPKSYPLLADTISQTRLILKVYDLIFNNEPELDYRSFAIFLFMEA